ncbi:MAG: 2-oxoacid:acceptor oxidoreductase family protein [bacterium]
MKEEHILIAGSGGQGILLIGKLLAQAALKTARHVTFFPSYGAEVRGGTSNCQICLSPNEIASPVAATFDSMLLMNPASITRYRNSMLPGGLTVFNCSLCPDCQCNAQCVGIPASERANQLGDTRVANLVMLGAFLARRKLVPPTDIESGITAMLKRRHGSLVEINIEAFHAGLLL